VVTSAHQLGARTRLQVKHVLFVALGLMTAFVIYHDEGFFIDHRSKTWNFFQPVLWKLIIHAVGGSTALVFGALQFSSRLRELHPAIHRVLGRIYIGGVLTAAPMAAYLALTHALPSMATETIVQASVWVVTTLMALLAARNHNFEIHRQWVMRSYAVTLIFVFARIVLALPIAPTSDQGAERMAWILIVCALLVPQVIINWRELLVRNAR
jgi:hypothetical protein